MSLTQREQKRLHAEFLEIVEGLSDAAPGARKTEIASMALCGAAHAYAEDDTPEHRWVLEHAAVHFALELDQEMQRAPADGACICCGEPKAEHTADELAGCLEAIQPTLPAPEAPR